MTTSLKILISAIITQLQMKTRIKMIRQGIILIASDLSRHLLDNNHLNLPYTILRRG